MPIVGGSGSGRPFYTRLIPGGFSRIAGLGDVLSESGVALELASGAGIGLVHFAHSHSGWTAVGVDGDRFSIELAQSRIDEHGLAGRVSMRRRALEELMAIEEFDLAFISISMPSAAISKPSQPTCTGR